MSCAQVHRTLYTRMSQSQSESCPINREIQTPVKLDYTTLVHSLRLLMTRPGNIPHLHQTSRGLHATTCRACHQWLIGPTATSHSTSFPPTPRSAPCPQPHPWTDFIPPVRHAMKVPLPSRTNHLYASRWSLALLDAKPKDLRRRAEDHKQRVPSIAVTVQRQNDPITCASAHTNTKRRRKTHSRTG